MQRPCVPDIELHLNTVRGPLHAADDLMRPLDDGATPPQQDRHGVVRGQQDYGQTKVMAGTTLAHHQVVRRCLCLRLPRQIRLCVGWRRPPITVLPHQLPTGYYVRNAPQGDQATIESMETPTVYYGHNARSGGSCVGGPRTGDVTGPHRPARPPRIVTTSDGRTPGSVGLRSKGVPIMPSCCRDRRHLARLHEPPSSCTRQAPGEDNSGVS